MATTAYTPKSDIRSSDAELHVDKMGILEITVWKAPRKGTTTQSTLWRRHTLLADNTWAKLVSGEMTTKQHLYSRDILRGVQQNNTLKEEISWKVTISQHVEKHAIQEETTA